ncbi:MAG: methyltetrahydrofolate cobalamin methyltransferase [Firmicutes bacterium]|nr:methyltetrahydrofolate cobalamin methyltransferase [Bacillota bacterium]
MIIIGEKINGTIAKVGKAIVEKDEEYIRELAVRQAKAGADYIDVCAGTSPEIEVEVLKWLIKIVQNAVDKPLCIDSPNPNSIAAVIGETNKPGILNSVSLEGNKCEVIYPLLQNTKWQVIGLTCDDNGIPSNVQTRIDIARQIVEKADKYGISPDRIHIDPLVIALATDNSSLINFVNTMQEIKKMHPDLKVTSGLSNISFGMPMRRRVNQSFLSIAMFMGMDSAIMDPCDKKIMATYYITQALLGKDKFCRNLSVAYRRGSI